MHWMLFPVANFSLCGLIPTSFVLSVTLLNNPDPVCLNPFVTLVPESMAISPTFPELAASDFVPLMFQCFFLP